MDGFKSRLRDSLQVQFSVWLLIAILIVAIAAGIFSFTSAFVEANELQDDMLRQIAALFDREHLPLQSPLVSGQPADSDEESRVIVQYLAAGETSHSTSATIPKIPGSLQDGIQTVAIGIVPYRIFVRTLASGERLAVAQEAGLRDEIARDSALRTVAPILILVPVLLIIVAYLVRKLITPIANLSAEIDRRSEEQLQAFSPDQLPREVRPFIVAFNRLLARVSDAMKSQQRFVADAAHELRTPMTALSLQAERLSEAEMSDIAKERLLTLRQGLDRGRILLDQLLTLSKVQSASAKPNAKHSLRKICQKVLEDLLPLVESKNIDIGATDETDSLVLADELELTTMIKNLLDNAVRYTPQGGRIDLTIDNTDRGTTLKIDDTGPGIPTAEHSRVFDPFYRVLGNGELGSGLGLSIVRTIATRINAEVVLGYVNSDPPNGLSVKITFPAEHAHAPL